jgi:hypothetical protein
VPAESVDEHGCSSLDQPSLGPGVLSGAMTGFPTLSGALFPAGRELLDWLHATMSVLQSSVGAADFLERAVAALVRIVGLDTGRVLLRDGDAWAVQVAHGAIEEHAGAWRPSRHVLDRLCREKRAAWQRPKQATVPDSASLLGVSAVVAAPLLDAEANVIGALSGERYQGSPVGSQAGGKPAALANCS